jgi:hypothetical protein
LKIANLSQGPGGGAAMNIDATEHDFAQNPADFGFGHFSHFSTTRLPEPNKPTSTIIDMNQAGPN